MGTRALPVHWCGLTAWPLPLERDPSAWWALKACGHPRESWLSHSSHRGGGCLPCIQHCHTVDHRFKDFILSLPPSGANASHRQTQELVPAAESLCCRESCLPESLRCLGPASALPVPRCVPQLQQAERGPPQSAPSSEAAAPRDSQQLMGTFSLVTTGVTKPIESWLLR